LTPDDSKTIGCWSRSFSNVNAARSSVKFASVRQRQLDDAGTDRFYLPQALFWQEGSLVVRTKGPPLALAESVRKEILALS